MTSTTLALIGAAALVVGLLTLVAALARVAVMRRRFEAELTATAAEHAAERERWLAQIQELSATSADREPRPATPALPAVVATAITAVGGDPSWERLPVALPVQGDVRVTRLEGRLFVDTLLRESVVKGAALTHGLRHALSPRVRHQIRFEMGLEVKRSRRQRRSDQKRAMREFRARQRAESRADLKAQPDHGENVA